MKVHGIEYIWRVRERNTKKKTKKLHIVSRKRAQRLTITEGESWERFGMVVIIERHCRKMTALRTKLIETDSSFLRTAFKERFCFQQLQQVSFEMG